MYLGPVRKESSYEKSLYLRDEEECSFELEICHSWAEKKSLCLQGMKKKKFVAATYQPR